MPPRFWNTPLTPLLVQGFSAGLLLISTTFSFAQQTGSFDEAFDDEAKPWQEIAVQLPPPPLPANLAEIYVGPSTTAKSYIDTKSLTVGSDNVVRYIIVTKTSGGAINTSYEGIRCDTAEKKLYAFGHANGQWSPSRQKQWKKIIDVGANRQDAALVKSYFCQYALVSGDAKKIIARLRENHLIDPARD